MKKIIIAFPIASPSSDDIKEELSKEGFDVSIMNNGQEVLDSVIGNPPDLIFADANLPSKNAFEIIDKLKEEGKIKKTPVIVYSQTGSVEDKEKAIEYEAKDFITGYLNSPQEIARKIKTHLGEQKTYTIDISKDKNESLSLLKDLGYREAKCPYCKERLSLHLLRNLSLGKDVFKASFVCPICNYKTSKEK